MLPAQPNRSLVDGLACLGALASDCRPIGVRELARQLSLEPTRANRLLKTLAHLGLAQQLAGRKYTAGPAIHVLSAQSMFASGLVRRAVGKLESLHRYGLTVAMGVLWRDRVCYIYHADPGMSAAEALGRVGLFPATRSGIGMVLLGAQEETDVRQLLRNGPAPGCENAPEALLRDLETVRRQGYARVVSRRRPLSVTLGVAVGSPPYAGIALAGRIYARQTKPLVAALRRIAVEIDPGTVSAGGLGMVRKRPV